MKKLLLLLIVLSFLSCKKEAIKTTQAENSTAKRIDTIFLGYRFGMSKSDFSNHSKKLIAEKQLDKNALYHFTYQVVPTETIMEPKFYNNKLYQLILHTVPTDDVLNNTDLVYYDLASIYLKKYQLKEVYKGISLEYTENNLELQIQNNIQAPYVKYTDLPINEIVEKTNDSIKKSESEKTLKNI